MGFYIRVISQILEEGQAKAEFSFDNSQFTALALYNILESLTRPWTTEVKDMSSEDKIEACINLLFNGLLTRKR